LNRSSVVFATILIIYFVFLIQLSNYLANVQMNDTIKALIMLFFLIGGMAIVGFAGK
jgi:hypothetical protein